MIGPAAAAQHRLVDSRPVARIDLPWLNGRVRECGIGTLARILMSRRDCTTGGISLLANGKGTSTSISTVAWLGFLCFLFSYFTVRVFSFLIREQNCPRLFELDWNGVDTAITQTIASLLGVTRVQKKR